MLGAIVILVALRLAAAATVPVRRGALAGLARARAGAAAGTEAAEQRADAALAAVRERGRGGAVVERGDQEPVRRRDACGVFLADLDVQHDVEAILEVDVALCRGAGGGFFREACRAPVEGVGARGVRGVGGGAGARVGVGGRRGRAGWLDGVGGGGFGPAGERAAPASRAVAVGGGTGPPGERVAAAACAVFFCRGVVRVVVVGWRWASGAGEAADELAWCIV